MLDERREKKKSRKGGCFSIFGWGVVLATALLLVILFLANTLGDMGVWDEFWDLFK